MTYLVLPGQIVFLAHLGLITLLLLHNEFGSCSALDVIEPAEEQRTKRLHLS